MNIRLGNVSLVLEGELDTAIADEIRKTLSYVVPGHEFMPRYKQDQILAAKTGKTPWDGTKTVARWRDGNIVAPTGLFSYVREIFQKHGVQYTILDERPVAVSSPGWTTEGFDRRDYQIGPTDTALNRQRGVFQMGTGAGKTECAIYIVAKAASIPAMFYVTSTDLLIQAHEKFTKYMRYNGQPTKIGIVGGGHFDLQPITMCTVQTAEKALSGVYTKYQYDDYDENDDTKLNEKQRAELGDYIRSCQCFFCDECFSYDTMVYLPNGKQERIGVLVNKKYKGHVLSFNKDEKRFEKKRVVGWIRKKPTEKIVRVRLGNVSGITCTDNHVFHTMRGEVRASELRRGDAVVSLLGKKRSVQALGNLARQVVLGTSIGDGAIMFGNKKSVGARLVMTHGKKQYGYLSHKCRFLDQLNSKTRKAYSGYTGEKEKQSVSRSSVELAFYARLSKKERINLLDPFGMAVHFLDDGTRNGNYGTIACNSMTKDEVYCLRDKFLEYGMKTQPSLSSKGYVLYIPKASMDVFGEYIAKMAPRCMRYKVVDKYKSTTPIKPPPGPKFGYSSVVSVKPARLKEYYDYYQDVYCLTVEDNHNFVVGSCVVNNCHHTSCDTIQTIISNSHSARYRFGMSASPWRDDGLDILIEAAFGRKICEIPSSLLIDKGFLVQPTIIFNHFTQALGPAGNFNSHYTRYVVENHVRNKFIAERALEYSKNQGLPTVVLVKWAKHATILADLIQDCEVLTSSGSKKKNPKKRKLILDKMRSREVKCIIATTLLDEGVDVPSASVGIFAGGGKSSTRALQRVGRFIRPDPMVPDKKGAIIEEFWDHTKWLMHHAKIRKKIYQTEHRYIIADNSDTLKL